MHLAPDDVKHLLAAQGYAELMMYADAKLEIEHIPPQSQSLAEILAIRVDIHRGLKEWAAMQAVASKLTESDPENSQWAISYAYATRRAESIDVAKKILLTALERHPDEPMIHYNLACYECQQQHMDAAKRYLTVAFKLEKRLRLTALEDQDLKPFKEELRRELI